ncbi:MAG TPA: hypothetical protein VJ986_15180 [Gaiellaceae bacterium]|nr:hypothetical protein [Gaiellaceae bacterium]
MTHQLRLTSSSGVELVARLVYHGETYGGGQLVNTGYRSLAEFLVPRGVSSRLNAVYPADELPLEPGWAPGGVAQLALPEAEIERLGRWIADPSAVEDAGVLLVGDDEELDKALVALGRLDLDPVREAEALRALARARAVPPALIVVGQEVGRLGAAELVRRLVAAAETRDVPVIVVGGSEAEATAAGAALHVSTPPDYAAFADDASELLDMV